MNHVKYIRSLVSELKEMMDMGHLIVPDKTSIAEGNEVIQDYIKRRNDALLLLAVEYTNNFMGEDVQPNLNPGTCNKIIWESHLDEIFGELHIDKREVAKCMSNMWCLFSKYYEHGRLPLFPKT